MNEPIERGLGELLEAAVPPLPEPVDRIAEVRARVRRTRLATGGTLAGVAALVALFLLVPSVLAPGRSSDDPATAAAIPDHPGCVEARDVPFATASPADPPPVQPVAEGAVEVLLCDYNFDHQRVDSWVLTTGVDMVVDALNHLASEEEVEANPDLLPDDGPVCVDIYGYTSATGLVFRYPDGATTAIFWQVCNIWTTADSWWYGGGEALDLFRRLYIAQLGAVRPSGDVEVGGTYRQTIYLHCGVDFFHFDGRVWRAEEPDPTSRWDAIGDIAYVDRNTLWLTILDGEAAGEVFVLHRTNDPGPGCD